MTTTDPRTLTDEELGADRLRMAYWKAEGRPVDEVEPWETAAGAYKRDWLAVYREHLAMCQERATPAAPPSEMRARFEARFGVATATAMRTLAQRDLLEFAADEVRRAETPAAPRAEVGDAELADLLEAEYDRIWRTQSTMSPSQAKDAFLAKARELLCKPAACDVETLAKVLRTKFGASF